MSGTTPITQRMSLIPLGATKARVSWGGREYELCFQESTDGGKSWTEAAPARDWTDIANDVRDLFEKLTDGAQGFVSTEVETASIVLEQASKTDTPKPTEIKWIDKSKNEKTYKDLDKVQPKIDATLKSLGTQLSTIKPAKPSPSTPPKPLQLANIAPIATTEESRLCELLEFCTVSSSAGASIEQTLFDAASPAVKEKAKDLDSLKKKIQSHINSNRKKFADNDALFPKIHQAVKNNLSEFSGDQTLLALINTDPIPKDKRTEVVKAYESLFDKLSARLGEPFVELYYDWNATIEKPPKAIVIVERESLTNTYKIIERRPAAGPIIPKFTTVILKEGSQYKRFERKGLDEVLSLSQTTCAASASTATPPNWHYEAGGAGDCAAYALSAAMLEAQGHGYDKANPSLMAAHIEQKDRLRQEVSDLMHSKPEEFIDEETFGLFVEALGEASRQDEAHLRNVFGSSYQEFKAILSSSGQMETDRRKQFIQAYALYIRNGGTWLDGPFFEVASRIHKKKIVILNDQGIKAIFPKQKRTEAVALDKDTLFVYHTQGHYKGVSRAHSQTPQFILTYRADVERRTKRRALHEAILTYKHTLDHDKGNIAAAEKGIADAYRAMSGDTEARNKLAYMIWDRDDKAGKNTSGSQYGQNMLDSNPACLGSFSIEEIRYHLNTGP